MVIERNWVILIPSYNVIKHHVYCWSLLRDMMWRNHLPSSWYTEYDEPLKAYDPRPLEYYTVKVGHYEGPPTAQISLLRAL